MGKGRQPGTSAGLWLFFVGLLAVWLAFRAWPANKTGMSYLRFLMVACLALILTGGQAGADALAADSLAPVASHSFSEMDSSGVNADGALPLGGLTDGGDGYFYGAASAGGAAGGGTVFRLRTDGTGFAVLRSLDPDTEGSGPTGALTLGGDGLLYGTTSADGPDGAGTVFRLGRDGAGFAVLHSFDGGADGGFCPVGVTAGGDGFLYGVAGGGDEAGDGTLFRLRPDGSEFATLHTFTGEAEGAWPLAALTASGGLLYGTTFLGGADSAGTVFRMAPDGSGFQTVYEFTGDADGASPAAGLTDGGDGFLYGTAISGGDTGDGTLYRLHGDGSGFTTVHSFAGEADGSEPLGALQWGADGRLYGMAFAGGPSLSGTAYTVGADGTEFAVLAAFSADTGGLPCGALLAGGDGRLYGTTYSGGSGGAGTVFFLGAAPHAAAPEPVPGQTHLLWTTAAGAASLWTVEADGSFRHFDYGPFAGWTAIGLSTGADGVSHLLWRGGDGTLSLWNVDAQGGFTYRYYGPFAGWTPRMISADPDGGQWVVWTHAPDGQVSLWRLDSSGERLGLAIYGPFAGWSPVALASGPAGSVRLTWTHAPDGQMSLWDLDPDTLGYAHTEFGPYQGWTAGAAASASRGVSRVLWTQPTGQVSLWALNGEGFTHTEYGPYDGWRARGVAVGPDDLPHLLWTRPADGLVSLWAVDAQGGFAFQYYGPYAGWSAVAVSAGPPPPG